MMTSNNKKTLRFYLKGLEEAVYLDESNPSSESLDKKIGFANKIAKTNQYLIGQILQVLEEISEIIKQQAIKLTDLSKELKDKPESSGKDKELELEKLIDQFKSFKLDNELSNKIGELTNAVNKTKSQTPQPEFGWTRKHREDYSWLSK